ncbi:MAG: MarR family transcriptional regulator [Marinilabiliales bacterium]|nr:MarR family transcriptional regulator [Marinilabiliales bacterium]
MEKGKEILGLVYEMKQKCAAIDSKLMDQLNLSQSELMFFTSLDRCVEINSPELSRSMGLSLSRISRVVDKLVLDGYLDRNIDKTDRRAITLCLTEKGRAIRSEIERSRAECEARLVGIVPESQLSVFKEVVERMVKEL